MKIEPEVGDYVWCSFGNRWSWGRVTVAWPWFEGVKVHWVRWTHLSNFTMPCESVNKERLRESNVPGIWRMK